MVNILVLGGSKFTGKHLLRKIATSDNTITVVNRGNVPTEEFLPQGATFIKANRDNAEEMKEAVGSKDFDIVYDFYAITEDHVLNLLNVIGKVGRHVHVSSASVYPSFTNNLLQIPIDEDVPFGPIDDPDEHPYLVNKRRAENALMKAHKENGYPVTIVRPTYIYGSDNYIYRDHYFFDRIDQERPVLIPGDGEVIIDMIHCDDLADLMILLGNADPKLVVGEAFNGSSGYVLSGNQYARYVGEILGKEPKIVNIPLETLKKVDRDGKFYFYPYSWRTPYALSMYKASNILGFKAKYTYRTGLEDFHKWWLDNAKEEGVSKDFTLEDKILAFHQSMSRKPTGEEYVSILQNLQNFIDSQSNV